MKELRQPDEALKKILPEQKLLSGKQYVPSVFALPYEWEGRHLWFHTLTRQLIEPACPLPDQTSSGSISEDEELSALMRGYFLVPEGKDETVFYRDLFQVLHALVKKKGVKGFTILPTTACNARCVYCFEEGRKQETMTPEMTERVVDYISRVRRPDEIVIEWFGGEPLAAADVIDSICGQLEEKDIPFKSSIVTNGSLVTEEIADRMAGVWKLDHVQVSMDSDEHDYIARKQYIHYEDQYHKVLNGIRMMAERGIQVSVRCNVDQKNVEGIPSFLSDLARAVPDKENVDVYLSGLNDERMGDSSHAIWKKIVESRALIRSFGFKGEDTRLTLAGIRNHHCKADLGSVVIGPDGSLYSCEECHPASRFGNIADNTEDTAAKTAFCRVDRIRKMCRNCPFLPECTPFASCPVQEKQCVENRRLRFNEKIREYLSGINREE